MQRSIELRVKFSSEVHFEIKTYFQCLPYKCLIQIRSVEKLDHKITYRSMLGGYSGFPLQATSEFSVIFGYQLP